MTVYDTKNSKVKKALAIGTGASAAVALALTGCDDSSSSSSKKKKDDPPTNHAPVISTTTIADFEEDITAQRTINFSDSDGDNLNISVLNGPSGGTLTKLSNTQARFSGTFPDATVGTYNMTFRVSDGDKVTERVFTFKVLNTVDLTLTANDAETGAGLTDARFTLDDGAGRTYSGDTIAGVCTIENVRDGNYGTTLEHLAATHQTCQLGTAVISDASNTTATEILYQAADSTEVNDVLRRHGAGLAKYLTKPTKIRIYTLTVYFF